jgi:hypothetical protein
VTRKIANESLIRRYLLGDVSAEERSHIEDEYFADADFFEGMVAAENDLIDSYSRGRLSDSEREHFERKCKGSPDQLARIDFAKALAQVVESEKAAASAGRSSLWSTRVSFFRLPRLQLAWAFGVATVLVMGLSVLGIQYYELRKELRDERANATRLQQEGEVLRAQVAALSENPQTQRGEEGGQIAKLETPAELSFRLLPGATRGGPAGEDLVLPRNGGWVRLEMVLDRDEFRTYEAVLQTAEGKDVLRANGLKSASIGGVRVVLWRVQSGKIQPGDYAVRLRGEKNDGSIEEADAYSLTVSRR